jgi:1-acyl-sn-glycerol-3-phosphate acyltransferase
MTMTKKKATVKTPSAGWSVLDAMKGRTIFIIGGTGFLGRVMLYYFVKFIPDVKLILLIRPTHGRTGQDRLEKEVLGSPVFTHNPDDAGLRAKALKMIEVVDGDATRKNLGLSDELYAKTAARADVVLNTAGNVEFNPPLDASLNANTLSTLNALEFAAESEGAKYVHVSTCYVADRTVHRDSSPENHVAGTVVTSRGNEVKIDVVREIEMSRAKIDEVRKEYEAEDRMVDFRERARKELKKSGRGDQERLVEKIAKNIRTFELREALIRAGKERAERLNRPNVYTYTKTLAELLVQERKDVDSTIVRPSIVEAAVQFPFTGWNEGIQGSAPIIFMMHRGHKMIPSISKNPGEREDAVLDLIPVDFVAAGTILAMAALLEKRHRPVYQLAAGPIRTPMTITRCLHISQTTLRDLVREEDTGVKRWARLNVQAVTVSRPTFERFSSPRTLKFLEKVKARAEHWEDRAQGPAQKLVSKLSRNVEKFYNVSLLKNRMFQEFMPFINHGFPAFHNTNAIELWRELPPEERKIFRFNPNELDYIGYFSDIHIPGVVKYVFPILEKRFQSALKTGSEEETGISWKDIKEALSEGDLKERLKNLRKALPSGKAKPPETKGAVEREKPVSFVVHHAERFGSGSFKEWEDDNLKRFADHLQLITGVRLSGEEIKELRTTARLEAHLKKAIEAHPPAMKPFRFKLPKEGLDIPGWAADPTRGFLYRVQMWFYKNVLHTTVRGQKNVPWNNHHVIVVANHASHLDYGLVQFALGKYGQHMGILAARDYFFNNFWKSTFFTHLMTTIPIERETQGGYSAALKNAFKFLEKGGPLLIFPEGTRSEDGTIQQFKHGLGYLVQHTGADVLPVQIQGTHKALPKGKTVLRGRKVTVQIGKLIRHEELAEETKGLSPTKTYDVIAKKLEKAVRVLDHG